MQCTAGVKRYVLKNEIQNLASVVLDDVLDVDFNWNLIDFRLTSQSSLQRGKIHIEVTRNCWQNVTMNAFSSHLEWHHCLALSANLNGLAWLNTVGWAINKIAIYQNVTMHNKLASLSGCASKTCAQN